MYMHVYIVCDCVYGMNVHVQYMCITYKISTFIHVLWDGVGPFFGRRDRPFSSKRDAIAIAEAYRSVKSHTVCVCAFVSFVFSFVAVGHVFLP